MRVEKNWRGKVYDYIFDGKITVGDAIIFDLDDDTPLLHHKEKISPNKVKTMAQKAYKYLFRQGNER